MSFIGRRDSFHLALVSATGWPLIQRRGGAPGFVRALSPKLMAFLDLGGRPPSLAGADVPADNAVTLLFTDYAQSESLEVLGRLTLATLEDAPYLAAQLLGPGEQAGLGGLVSIRIEGFNWRHGRQIARRYTALELEPLTRRIAALEAQNATLRAMIAAKSDDRH